jgi:hypothetical protein
MEAVGEQHRIRMRYYSVHSQKKKEYLLDPYRLMYFRGGLYLFRVCPGVQADPPPSPSNASSLSTSCMTVLRSRMTSQSKRIWSLSFGLVKEDPFDVEIVFGPTWPNTFDHASGIPRSNAANRGGRIRMKLHVGGEFELVSWILSFGPSAQVISPERLLGRVERELARALENYRKEITVAPRKKARKVEARKVETRKAAARH